MCLYEGLAEKDDDGGGLVMCMACTYRYDELILLLYPIFNAPCVGVFRVCVRVCMVSTNEAHALTFALSDSTVPNIHN